MFQFVVHGILLPIVALFGFVSNIISIFIFTRSEMRTSINLILTGVAAFDLYTIMSTFTIYTIDAWKIPSLDIRYPILYPSAHTAYMGSMYLTVLLTFERCLAV